MKRLFLIGIALSALFLPACSEVSRRGTVNFGVKQVFVSQAGNCNNKVLISTGKVDSSTQSDGWGIIDARTDKLVRVAGDAIIVDATPEQISIYMGAKTLPEAQANLLEYLQKDGTILPEPKVCQR